MLEFQDIIDMVNIFLQIVNVICRRACQVDHLDLQIPDIVPQVSYQAEIAAVCHWYHLAIQEIILSPFFLYQEDFNYCYPYRYEIKPEFPPFVKRYSDSK